LIIAIAGSSGNNKSHSSTTPPPQSISVTTPSNTPQPTPRPTPAPTPTPTPVEWIDTGIIIEYDDNLFLYKYDVRVSVNDVSLGILKQGDVEFFELFLTEDTHEITLSEFGNDGNITTDTFKVTAGSYNYFFIKTRNSGIEIERRDTMTHDEMLILISVSDDVIATTPIATPSPTPSSTPSPTITPTPTPTPTPTATPSNSRADLDAYFDEMDMLILLSDGVIIDFMTERKDDYSMIRVIVSDAWYNSEDYLKERFAETVSELIENISKETGVSNFVSVSFYDINNKKLAEPKLFGGYRILR